MNRPRNMTALVRYNALRCERAKSRACRCHCGGAFHGKQHGEAWIQRAARELSTAALERDNNQGELLEVAI